MGVSEKGRGGTGTDRNGNQRRNGNVKGREGAEREQELEA